MKQTFIEHLEEKYSGSPVIGLSFIKEEYRQWEESHPEVPSRKSLKWEEVMKTLDTVWWISTQSNVSCGKLQGLGVESWKNALPTESTAKTFLAMMQWKMIAFYANGKKEIDWNDNKPKFYLRFDRMNSRVEMTSTFHLDSGEILFNNEDLLQQAWDENPEIVNSMFGITK